MTRRVPPRAREIFLRALELPPEDRRRFVEAECGNDAPLRTNVLSLLSADEKASELGGSGGLREERNDVAQSAFATDPEETAAASVRPAGPAKSHPRIGSYRILEKIGEGGFGEVYTAEQTAPVKRMVALKILKPGMDTKSVLARFEAERQALARMDHPNIAKVLDAGETDAGRPYFVMDLVKGESITKYCDRHTLSTEERLDLFLPVCQAVQHAHQKGIIHRDLKPSNILVMLTDGKPVPKVIDFGIAKATTGTLTDRTLHTMQGHFIGTPEYMSPEQAEMGGLDVDTTTDVYSLGVVLYELLAGALPFDSDALRRKGYAEIQRILREEEPAKPSTKVRTRGPASRETAQLRRTDTRALARGLQGELDWIVLKAMAKDRTRRYETPNSLAADIRRYLSDEPVLAGPPSAAYRFRKFAKRNRVAIGFVSAVILALAIGFVESNRQRLKAEASKAAAEASRDESEAVTKFLADMLSSVQPDERGRDVTVKEVLVEASRTIGEKFGEQPAIEGRLRYTIGTTYDQLGDYSEAERHLREAVKLRSRTLGEEDVETLRSILSLASTLANDGRLVDSEALLLPLLEAQRRELGEEHPETLRSMTLLASVYRDQGRAAEAESLYVQNLATHRRVFGEQDRRTLGCLENLARLYIRMGRYDESGSMFRSDMEIRRRTLGEEHPRTLHAKHYVALSLFAAQRYEEAESLLVSTIAAKRRVLGDEHPGTLQSVFQLASGYADQDRFEEAESLVRPLLDSQRRLLGSGHPNTIYTMDVLLGLLNSTGRTDEARALAVEIVDLRRQAAESRNADARSKNGYAMILLTGEPSDLQNPQEALRFALAANEQTGFADAYLLDTLALAYHRTGQTERAIEVQDKAIALLHPDDSNRSDCEARLAEYKAALEATTR